MEVSVDLSTMLGGVGELASAQSLYERAWVINEKVLGPEHPASFNDLASLLRAQGDLAGPQPLCASD
jgi:Tetratricopeptide repeat